LIGWNLAIFIVRTELVVSRKIARGVNKLLLEPVLAS